MEGASRSFFGPPPDPEQSSWPAVLRGAGDENRTRTVSLEGWRSSLSMLGSASTRRPGVPSLPGCCCVPACVPLQGVHSCPQPCADDRISRLSCVYIRRRTSTNPAPGNCQLHGLSRLLSRPTDHERPPDMAMVDGDQAANAWGTAQTSVDPVG